MGSAKYEGLSYHFIIVGSKGCDSDGHHRRMNGMGKVLGHDNHVQTNNLRHTSSLPQIATAPHSAVCHCFSGLIIVTSCNTLLLKPRHCLSFSGPQPDLGRTRPSKYSC